MTDVESPATTMINPVAMTTYFEIDSRHVGDRFAISVSVPMTYNVTDEPLPVLYATDGKVMAPLSDGVAFSMLLREAITQCRPYIQVDIGYPGDRAPDMLTIRNRDLVPPGEPISKAMYRYIRAGLVDAYRSFVRAVYRLR